VSRNLSPTTEQALYDEETGEVIATLITISHADLNDPIRLTDNGEDVTYNGNTYMHFPYRIQLPRDEDEASGSLAHVEVDAVDRRVVEAIRNISGVPDFDLIVANISDPNSPTVEVEWPTFSLANARYDSTSVKGDLVLEVLTEEPFPADKQDPSRFPGMF